MKKYLEILKSCPLFYDIEENELISMLHCLGVKIKLFDKKQTVIAEGERAEYICIMLSGTAQILRVDYYGNRSIVTKIEKSDIFCEAFACAEIKSIPVTIVADEPCEVMLIDCSCVLHTCEKNCVFHQKLIFNLMKALAIKNIMFHQKIEITSKRTTREKLMAYLMFQAKKAGSNSFVIPFDRQELADYLEVDRSGLSAEISKLRNEGIIESERKKFKLL